MRVLVLGAGGSGADAIKQLRKNPAIEIITADPKEEPLAVQEGVVEKVDIVREISPISLEEIVEEANPDLILLTLSTDDMGLGHSPGVDILADSLREELAALAGTPVIEVARTGR